MKAFLVFLLSAAGMLFGTLDNPQPHMYPPFVMGALVGTCTSDYKEMENYLNAAAGSDISRDPNVPLFVRTLMERGKNKRIPHTPTWVPIRVPATLVE